MDERILAVQRMQEYIGAHLGEQITLDRLSEESLFSPWYSYRLFREYTGLTVRTTSVDSGCPNPLCGSKKRIPK